MADTTLSRRAVNRATLDRQLLLRRAPMSPLQAIEHLVGLQAQTPHTWYVGLWTRLVDCDPAAVGALLTSRQVVRIALMRGTIHLVSAADALALRPLVQPMIVRLTNGVFGKRVAGADPADLIAAGRAAVEGAPLTFSALGRVLAVRWPDGDPSALAQTVRAGVPLVQVPPRGVWGASGPVAHTSLESWVGEPMRADYPVEDMLRRYLAAFGPATVADMQTWSGLTKLAEVADRMRDELVAFRGEDGAELFDLPDAARPDPDTPAPARYLYDFDNLLLSHADRSRMANEAYPRPEFDPHGPAPRLVLVDGFTAATWTLEFAKDAATLTVRPFARLATADVEALTSEGAGLLSFAAAGKTHDIRFADPA